MIIVIVNRSCPIHARHILKLRQFCVRESHRRTNYENVVDQGTVSYQFFGANRRRYSNSSFYQKPHLSFNTSKNIHSLFLTFTRHFRSIHLRKTKLAVMK